MPSSDASETFLKDYLLSCVCWVTDCFSFLFTIAWDLEDMLVIVKALAFVWGCGLDGVYLF